MEEALAKEISFVYYLNLNDLYRFHVMEPLIYYSSLPETVKDKIETMTQPKEILLSMTRQNNDLREWIGLWSEDIVNHQNQITKMVKTIP